MDNLHQAKVQFEQTDLLLKEGKYADVVKICEKIVPIFEELEEWELYVDAMNKSSEGLWGDGKYDEGLEKANKSLAISISFLREVHPSTAESNRNIAICYLCKGKFNIALQYYKKSLSIRQI